MKNNRLKVLYFAVQDLDYPRNERIRAYLSGAVGARVDVVTAIQGGGRLHRYLGQLKLALKQPRDYDVVVLSEFSLSFFPFSWLVAKRSRAAHLVDFFVGLHETEIGDAKTAAPNSIRARVLSGIDRLAIRSADACFTDTALRARRFFELSGHRTPFYSLPVGAPAWARYAVGDVSAVRTTSRVLYYGSYLPLHGLVAFVESMRDPEFDDYLVRMIGKGPMRARVQSMVETCGLTGRFEFIDYAEPAVLVQHVRDSDVILGVFGESEKAAEVIPNKVWQGLSMGKAVVTRRSCALVEISQIAGPLLIQVRSATALDIHRGLSKARAGLAQGSGEVFQVDRVGEELEQLVRSRFDEVFSSTTIRSLFGN